MKQKEKIYMKKKTNQLLLLCHIHSKLIYNLLRIQMRELKLKNKI